MREQRPSDECDHGEEVPRNHFLLLSLAAQMRGYDSRYWATYPQWQSLGGQVRKGERGVQIVLWKPIRKVTVNGQGQEEVDSFPLMRSWTVFNVAACDGSLDKFRATAPASGTPFVDYDPAERVLAATGADVRHGGGKAFYCPDGDFIQLPQKSAFLKTHEYYGVLAHETVHWSGHKSRLDRLDKTARFGSESYAMEELVAELGSAMLLVELGVPQSEDMTNVVAYLGHWLNVLERDHYAVFTASSAASRAVEFILDFSRQPEAVADEPEAVEAVGVAG
jgi:antirestriction protein ArdC